MDKINTKYPDIIKGVTLHHIYDGDTIHVNIEGYPDLIGKNIGIRILGIDTPEMHDKDPAIRAKAVEAKHLAEKLIPKGTKMDLQLKSVDRGKFFRIVAYVYINGVNYSLLMLKSGLAKAYWGGTKESWKSDKSPINVSGTQEELKAKAERKKAKRLDKQAA